jgi:dihydrofolate synthase/folylpolyglutamate synthase
MFIGRSLDGDALTLATASLTSPGRLDVVARRPIIILDGSHNAEGIRGLATTLDLEFPPIQWKLVLGLRGMRSVPELLSPLKGRVDAVYAAAVDDPASHDPDALAPEAGSVLGVPSSGFDDALTALAAARDDAGPEGGVVVAGSLYLVGEVYSTLGTPTSRPSEAHVRYEAEVDVDGVPDEPEGQDPALG